MSPSPAHAMAEGPVVHLYSRLLAKILEGETIDVEFTDPELKPLGPSLRGVRVVKVDPHGKQFRIRLSDGRVILVHLLLWGSWSIHEKGKRPRPAGKPAPLVLRTARHEVAADAAPVVAVLTAEELDRHPKYGDLGPDPLRDDFSRNEFLRRLQNRGSMEIGRALLDQRVMAGLGNILKNEILFRARVHPERRVEDLGSDEKDRIVRWSVDLCRLWLEKMVTEKEDRWMHVYKKEGQPCPECGRKIVRFRQGGRPTYICPNCQKEEKLELFR